MLPASIKSINPIQKYTHNTELYAWILKIFVTTIELSTDILISFGICSTLKLSEHASLLFSAYKAIQGVPVSEYWLRMPHLFYLVDYL